MADIKQKHQADNGVAGLRAVANIITFLGVFGVAWGLILAVISSITWSLFLWICVGCAAALISRYVLLALASCAEAASRYLEKNHSDE